MMLVRCNPKQRDFSHGSSDYGMAAGFGLSSEIFLWRLRPNLNDSFQESSPVP
jgi:hypothetical protein